MHKLTQLFFNLVKIDSPSYHEQDMVKFISTFLDKIDLKYFVTKRGNILINHIKNSKPILLCAHMDTVEPGQGIVPILEKGILKSKGDTILGSDNKAAVASILFSLEKLMKGDKSFEILFTIQEEVGDGLNGFPFKKIKSRNAFIFDYSVPLGGIVLRSPHIVNFYIEILGKAAHSSRPEEGKNALKTAGQILNKIQVGALDKGNTTINIGKMDSGSGINIIPEKANLAGEIRSYNRKLFDKHLENITSAIKKVSNKNKIKIKVTTNGFSRGYNHVKSDKIVNNAKAGLKSLGLKTSLYDFSSISDANILNAAGIKTLVLADGVKNPHPTKEQIAEKDLTKLPEIIYKLFEHL